MFACSAQCMDEVSEGGAPVAMIGANGGLPAALKHHLAHPDAHGDDIGANIVL